MHAKIGQQEVMKNITSNKKKTELSIVGYLFLSVRCACFCFAPLLYRCVSVELSESDLAIDC